MTVELSLTYEDNGSAHDDLTLRFAGRSWLCDSYYFGIDGGMQPEDGSPNKVKTVLCKLLEQWLTTVEDLPNGSTAFLPYDFSDQHTGWLRCERGGDTMTVSQGFAPIEGWSIFPSEIGEYLNLLPSFIVDETTAEFSKEELLQAIQASLENIK